MDNRLIMVKGEEDTVIGVITVKKEIEVGLWRGFIYEKNRSIL